MTSVAGSHTIKPFINPPLPLSNSEMTSSSDFGDGSTKEVTVIKDGNKTITTRLWGGLLN